mgnify:CR=1 FL=1|jgi:hypothetical protein
MNRKKYLIGFLALLFLIISIILGWNADMIFHSIERKKINTFIDYWERTKKELFLRQNPQLNEDIEIELNDYNEVAMYLVTGRLKMHH